MGSNPISRTLFIPPEALAPPLQVQKTRSGNPFFEIARSSLIVISMRQGEFFEKRKEEVIQQLTKVISAMAKTFAYSS